MLLTLFYQKSLGFPCNMGPVDFLLNFIAINLQF